MSRLPFHDTIQLYHDTGESWRSRRVTAVKTIATHAETGTSAVIWLPLYGRRSLRWIPPEEDTGFAGTFSVRPGDKLVCGPSDAGAPPEDALTVRSLTVRQAGSRRLRHLTIRAEFKREETEDEEDTTE